MSPSEHVDAMALEHLGEAYTLSAELQKYLALPTWDKEMIEVVRSKIARLAGLLQIVEHYGSYTGDELVVPHMEDLLNDSYIHVAAHTSGAVKKGEDSYAMAA